MGSVFVRGGKLAQVWRFIVGGGELGQGERVLEGRGKLEKVGGFMVGEDS